MPAAAGGELVDGALPDFLRRSRSVINLDEVDVSPEAYDGLYVSTWLRELPRAWLVIPLFLHDDVVGFVVLARSRGKISVNWEVSDLLKTAAGQAVTYVAQAQAADELARAKQFESFNKMSAFVVHDLKNLVAQLTLLLRNAQRHRDNPAFQEDMLSTIESSVAKMNRILMQLRSGGLPIEAAAPVLLDDVVAQAVLSKSMYQPRPTLEITDRVLWVKANAERLERVVGHLLQNAIEATPASGTVTVRVRRTLFQASIEIADTGKGMSPEFIRDALFKPFESTKKTGMGVGAFESREYIRELGGTMKVTSETGRGSKFEILLPVVAHIRADVEVNLRQGVG
jgi:putative PEP-CTERM system histidine kinase